ncbi:MAG: secondary thiamine-phosphate synthase enzyme YjbQ [Bacteroidales bacterium]
MIIQREIRLYPRSYGIHLITDELTGQLPQFPQAGILHLFIKHTSAGLAINENADPSVRDDFEHFLDYLIPENWSGYTHIMEGSDDMPAHIKSTLFGSSVSVPITNGRLNMGTWQGIYLGEFRRGKSQRTLVATIYS